MLCGLPTVQQAAIGNCLSLDPFPFDQNGLAPPEADVGGRQVGDALVISHVDEVLGSERPRVEDLARLRYIEQTLQETLRLWPTAPAFAVAPHEPTTLAGRYPVTPEDTLFVVIPVLHRDHGRRYRSLTLVARAITGAHWSGPRFFGLRERAGRSAESAEGEHAEA